MEQEDIEQALNDAANKLLTSRPFRTSDGVWFHVHSWLPETNTWQVTDPQRRTLYARVKVTLQVEVVPD